MEIEITKQEWKPVTEKVTIELPVTTKYYFITGERNAYMVKPEIYENKLYAYKIIKIGLSFECKINCFEVSVHRILDILKDSKAEGYSIINRLVNEPERGVRTREKFLCDLNGALYTINEVAEFENLKL